SRDNSAAVTLTAENSSVKTLVRCLFLVIGLLLAGTMLNVKGQNQPAPGPVAHAANGNIGGIPGKPPPDAKSVKERDDSSALVDLINRMQQTIDRLENNLTQLQTHVNQLEEQMRIAGLSETTGSGGKLDTSTTPLSNRLADVTVGRSTVEARDGASSMPSVSSSENQSTPAQEK